MKRKILSLLIALTLFSGIAYSQEADSQKASIQKEVYVGYGTPSTIPMITSIIGSIVGAIAGADEVDGHMTGVIQAGVNFYITNWFLAGAYASYEGFKMTFDNNDSDFMSLTTLQARIEFQYGPEKVKFYHGINGGVALMGGSGEKPFSGMFGFTPLGIKIYPKENFDIFVETGLISNAFFSAGVGFKF